ncbi:unnamed protein product, partial [Symbiodinium necroappetens]
MTITVHASLLSGHGISLAAEPHWDVGSLCLKVQQELGLSRIKVVTARGTVLGGAATLQEAGIEDGEALGVVVKDIEIVGTYDGRAFAMIGRDGSVVTWGQDSLGGDSTEVQHQLRNVQQIKGTRGAFAAILEDGSVCTWGETRQDVTFEAVCPELRDVRKLQASFGAFAAVRGDGRVVAWGSHSHGGRITGALKTKLQFVRDIEATGLAFAALCADGSVVAWGHQDSGGDCRAVADRLQEVWKIRSTMHAFAAIRKDGTVVTWGRVDAGGDSSAVQTQLTGVREIASTGYAFAAIRDDGSVVTWGRSEHGGDSRKIQEHLVNVKHVQGSVSTFAAIVGDGSIVAWGDRLRCLEIRSAVCEFRVKKHSQDPVIFRQECRITGKYRNDPVTADSFQPRRLDMNSYRSAMSINVEVALLSGRSVALLAELDWTIGRLLLAAQQQLRTGLDQLYAQDGELLNQARTLEESGLQSGNILQASVRPKRLASSSADFVLLCETGSVVACSEVCLGKTLLPHGSLVDVLHIQ